MYKVNDNGTIVTVVEEGTGRVGARFLSAEKAQRYVDALNEEERHGRKARGRCAEGFFCDYDRVNMPEYLTDADRASLVLCDWHGPIVDQRMAKGRAA